MGWADRSGIGTARYCLASPAAVNASVELLRGHGGRPETQLEVVDTGVELGFWAGGARARP